MSQGQTKRIPLHAIPYLPAFSSVTFMEMYGGGVLMTGQGQCTKD